MRLHQVLSIYYIFLALPLFSGCRFIGFKQHSVISPIEPIALHILSPSSCSCNIPIEVNILATNLGEKTVNLKHIHIALMRKQLHKQGDCALDMYIEEDVIPVILKEEQVISEWCMFLCNEPIEDFPSIIGIIPRYPIEPGVTVCYTSLSLTFLQPGSYRLYVSYDKDVPYEINTFDIPCGSAISSPIVVVDYAKKHLAVDGCSCMTL